MARRIMHWPCPQYMAWSNRIVNPSRMGGYCGLIIPIQPPSSLSVKRIASSYTCHLNIGTQDSARDNLALDHNLGYNRASYPIT